MVKRKEVKKILSLSSLAGGETSDLEKSEIIDLSKASSLAVTIRCTHGSGATSPLKVHLVASVDGSMFDTTDYDSFEAHLVAGSETQKTVKVDPEPLYLRVKVENPSGEPEATDIDVWATIGFEE